MCASVVALCVCEINVQNSDPKIINELETGFMVKARGKSKPLRNVMACSKYLLMYREKKTKGNKNTHTHESGKKPTK